MGSGGIAETEHMAIVTAECIQMKHVDGADRLAPWSGAGGCVMI